MSDNRTTELLRKLLEERGIEWKDGDATYEIEWSTPDGRHCSAMYWKPTLTVLISGCTPEQAIAAMLGSETCDAIFDKDYYVGINGVCESLKCSSCGNPLSAKFRHCPWCGARIRKAVER